MLDGCHLSASKSLLHSLPGSPFHIQVSKVRVKITQLCLTLCDPMDCSLPGSSQSMGFSRQEHWRGLPFSYSRGILPTQGLNPDPLPCRLVMVWLIIYMVELLTFFSTARWRKLSASKAESVFRSGPPSYCFFFFFF